MWLLLAALLGIAEIIAPGVFLFWIALGALATGLVTLFTGAVFAAQLVMFTLFSVLAVYGGRRWYASRDHHSTDPLLNNRAARMVGQNVVVVEAVSDHSGRVRVGDSDWPARGPNLAIGDTARIASVENGVVQLE